MSTLESPAIIGDLLPEELQQLTQLRLLSEQTLRQIGLNRVTEQRLIQQLNLTEQKAQMTLNQVGSRLGIPDATPWQVTEEGKAIVFSTKPVTSA
jgi:hypothetical protein